ncbi:dethiobiotin synthase [Phaeospirillum tilakii]|uniref:ATP-dependent dethiobiotin synthetase BioD n=1 Tax=Phaeospirillum tilakii TaxID=741673 RepID=A0ABW5CAC8_9PROT
MRGVFVTGTDTGIGKTLVSAWLARSWRASYWKPIQSGTVEGTDPAWVGRMAPGIEIIPPAVELQAPLSPHEAARRERRRIDLSTLVLPERERLVVEGAGGAMVPINDTALMVDLMVRFGLPAVVVARSGLGTINHTLMTLEVLRRRRVPLLGVVLNGQRNPANREAIEHFGGVPVLAEIQPLPAVTPAMLESLPAPSFACP